MSIPNVTKFASDRLCCEINLICALEATKGKVLKELEKRAGLPKEAREKFLLKAAGQQFYNTSPMDMSMVGSSDIKSNLLKYVDSFSKGSGPAMELWG